MPTIPALGLAAALVLAGCGGQSNQPADAGADAYVGDVAADMRAVDVATDSSTVDVQSDTAPSNDASQSPDSALCGGCASGLLCCNVLMGGTYQCIDPNTDPLDCGGCNTECGVNKYCGNGTCAVPPCSSTCTNGLCCGGACCAHGRICCQTDGGLQCVGGITCP